MRIEGWEKRLNDYIESCQSKEFKYGSFDCVIFAADAVKLVTGIDPIYEGRGEYKDLKSGLELIRKYRHSQADIMDFYFRRYDNKKRAKRGDIAMKVIDGQPGFGIVWQGGKVLFLYEGRGFVQYDKMDCLLIWEVD